MYGQVTESHWVCEGGGKKIHNYTNIVYLRKMDLKFWVGTGFWVLGMYLYIHIVVWGWIRWVINFRKFSIKFSSKNFFDRKSTNCLFLRSNGFLDVIGRCASKSYPQSFDFQLSTTFGGGVKEIVSIFAPTFGQKWLQPFSFFWLEDTCVLARRRLYPI